MTVKKTIFPVTRLHEPIRADVEIENGRVVNAWISAQLFRGFEQMLKGRDPRDVVLFTQRICGICSAAHSIAASMAQQEAFQIRPTPTGQALFNLIFAADMIQNHLRHFYLLVLPDYAIGNEIPLSHLQPKDDYRLPEKQNKELLSHIKGAIYISARAHEMLAIFGAKAPHQQTIMASGVTEQASPERLVAYRSILQEISDWVQNIYIPDVLTIAEYYSDYYAIGQGYGNFISFGMFPDPITQKRRLPSGILPFQERLRPLELRQIHEDIKFSWYEETFPNPAPTSSETIPLVNKRDAYSWVKAPRYNQQPYEGGPLARSWITGEYNHGISVMDRLIARAYETAKLCELAKSWLEDIAPYSPTLLPYTPPSTGEGFGITDAMRGPLLHWLRVEQDKVSNYQIITPSTWNFSTRDENGLLGPVEQALLGTPVSNPENLIEVGRVIRSFDPCFSCAVHCIQR